MREDAPPLTLEENEEFLRILRDVRQWAGHEAPEKVEVVFDNMSVEVEERVGRRALLTLPNAVFNGAKVCYSRFLEYLNTIKKDIQDNKWTEWDNQTIQGKVFYNGKTIPSTPHYLCSYVSQYDLHHAEMTVREIIDFSSNLLGTNNEFVYPGLTISKMPFLQATKLGEGSNLKTNYIIKIFGLSDCADTIVGDALLRGISGGQKKRTTIELAMTIKRLATFYKQRELLGLPGWAILGSIFLVNIPMSVLETGLWTCSTYHSIGYAPSPIRFCQQLLVLFAMHQMSMSLYRLIASIGRTQVMTNILGTEALIAIFILGGFIISKDDLQPWLHWGHWASPFTYSLNAAALNEFADKRWATVFHFDKVNTTGEAILKARGFLIEWHWYWVCVVVLFGFSLIFNLLSIFSLELLNYPQEHHLKVKPRKAIPGVPTIKEGQNPAAWALDISSHAMEYAIGVDYSEIYRNSSLHSEDEQDVLNILGTAYTFALFLGYVNCATFQPTITMERVVYYREKASGMYSSMPYVIAQVGVEILYMFIQVFMFSAVVYPMVGFEPTATKFFWFVLYMILSFIDFTLYGMMAVALTPNEEIATVLSFFIFLIWNVFAGFIVPRKMMPTWWRWMYWADPAAWTMYGLMFSQLGDHMELIRVPGQPDQPVSEFLKEYLGLQGDYIALVTTLHIALSILLGVVFFLGIKYLKFQRR
nr:unnamed protein product [Digitaria exilis]